MPETNIDATIATDQANTFEAYTVDNETITAAQQQKETTWISDTWTESYGYYKKIPEFKNAVDTKVRWTVGAGYQADETTTMLLDNIKGNGKQSFNGILKNQILVKIIDRDSYAEIVRDKDDVLVNLKPLNPEFVRSVYTEFNRIKRYELLDKRKNPIKIFQPDEIFHLSHERVANQIHGTWILDSLKWLILARNEAMSDWKKVLHRLIKPLIIWHLDTDDPTTIAAFKVTTDRATADNENLYIPKGTVEPEVVSVAANATLNPLTWINQLNDYFFQAVGVPQIISGNAKEFTDASGKIVYLAYEQTVKAEQLDVEEQVLAQLNVEINLEFPASLQNELITSKDKDSELQAAAPNDTTAELEGNT